MNTILLRTGLVALVVLMAGCGAGTTGPNDPGTVADNLIAPAEYMTLDQGWTLWQQLHAMEYAMRGPARPEDFAAFQTWFFTPVAP